MRLLRFLTVPLMFTLLLPGCQRSQEWHAKDISGLMPELEFELSNAWGQAVTEADYADQINLLFFGFTNCPDICPTTLAQLAASVRNLPEPVRGRVRILFVSVDPQRDTGERLAEYAGAFGERVVGLTGTQDQLQALTRRYRVTYGYDEADADGHYNVSHSSAVFAFDADGQVRLLIRDDLSPAQITEDLRRLQQST